MRFKSICVIGLGYIGLPTAAMFASKGVNVLGVDVCDQTIETINQGKVHIVEAGLDQLVESAVGKGKLKAEKNPIKADAYIIAVPTPLTYDEEHLPVPDLTYIKTACETIAPVLCNGAIIILESTSPVGTTEKICHWLSEMRPDITFPSPITPNSDISVAYCPERVLPGNIINELVENDRLIGGVGSACAEKVKKLYEIFVNGKCFTTDARTAEMAKLTENASRDLQIAFANELSIICENQNINVWELIELANKHPRVNILQPGPGVGGHCIAVDPWFIVNSNPNEAKLIKLSRQVNNAKPEWVIDQILEKINYTVDTQPLKSQIDVSVVLYGMTFKPDVDDFRESPALKIVKKIIDIHPGKVTVLEPNVSDRHMFDFDVVTTINENIQADVHVMLVDHKEFKNMPRPKNGALIDTRGIWQGNTQSV